MPSNLLVKELSNQLLGIYDPREAENIILTLLQDAHNLDRTSLLLGKDFKVDADLLEAQMSRLINHEPVQYVTGLAHFYDRTFVVDRSALIPRPETEELVDWVINDNQLTNPVIWDIGTGSGCIAITLAKEIKDAKVFGIDISKEALKVAESNARRNDADVDFCELNILEELVELPFPDIIVSNPPYIPESDKELMASNVLDFEPSEALFVSTSDPLIFYKRIVEVALKTMSKGGRLYFETHEKNAESVSDLLEQNGFQKIVIRKDLQGKQRMLASEI